MAAVDACGLYKKVCVQLHGAIGNLKDQRNAQNVEECMVFFSQLKKFNCKAQQQCKRVRDNTHQLKKKLDSKDLILKNLQFEEIYLQREIQKCHTFKSLDEELSLIPAAEWKASEGAITTGSKHEQMVQRLQWELEQRKGMKSKLETWEKKKTALEAEIVKLEEYLNSLPPQLDELLSSTTQVQDLLGLKLVQRRTQAEMAAWLPPELYNIYSQVVGYSEFLKSGTVVTINGDLERAKTKDSSSDTEEPVEVEGKHSKRRSAVQDPGKKKVFKAHPLTVEVVVPCDDGVHAKVLFTYLLKLRVVTVGISLMITTASPWREKFSVGTDYMSSKELLCDLWEGDHGEECPNPEMGSLLNKYSLPSKSKIPASLGRPFLWAQRLAGITGFQPGSPLSVQQSMATVPGFLAAIKNRCLARLSLKYQLRNIAANKLVKEGAISQPTILTELSSWKETQLENLPDAMKRHLSDRDSLYEVVVKRGKSSCKGYLALPLRYPDTPPFLTIELAGTKSDPNNVRAMEEELNVHLADLVEENPNYLLTKVIARLCLCFDIYLEGMGVEPQIKFFLSKFKGPSNILPFVYNPQRQLFEHR